jgi:hypothetical protein
MDRIFCESERFTVRTRTRAVEIFTTLATMICTIGKWGLGLGTEEKRNEK